MRLVNLPKKKNILRDLKAALQGIPGITNIAPAVIGNKKTRDPICKGFAFVDFKREEDAVRCVITSILCLLPTPNPKKNNNGEEGKTSFVYYMQCKMFCNKKIMRVVICYHHSRFFTPL